MLGSGVERSPASKPGVGKTSLSATLACCVWLGLTGCEPGKEEATKSGPHLTSASVCLQRVEVKTNLATEESVGTVQSKLQAQLEAKVPGRILEMRAVPGQSVKTGELLVRLDAQDIRARLDQALATQQQAASDLKRYTALVERDAATRAEFDAVQARARIGEAAVNEAQTVLSYAEVVAPFDAVVTRKLADVGDLAVPGRPLVSLEDPAHLQFSSDIPADLIANVKLGAAMPVRVEGSPEEVKAVVSEIAPAADPNSRTFRVKLDLASAAGLRAGQFGRVALPVAEMTALWVPTSALVRRGQLEMVFVVADRHAVMRLVKSGKRVGDQIEIASGLSTGESVVTQGAGSLVDGQPIETK
jgi:membrane fusion protein, multidrug efflux system